MAFITSISTPLLLSGTCYIATKGCEYLCSRPNAQDESIMSLFHTARELCASLRNDLVQYIGERNWTEFSQTVVNNSWISTFVVALLMQSFTLSFGGVFLGICLIADLATRIHPLRLAISQYLSTITGTAPVQTIQVPKPNFVNLASDLVPSVARFAIELPTPYPQRKINLSLFQVNKALRASRVEFLRHNDSVVSDFLRKALNRGTGRSIPTGLLQELKKIGPSIKSLDLSATQNIHPEMFRFLMEQFPNLETLDLTGADIENSTFQLPLPLTKLTTLKLGFNKKITDIGMSYIARIENLTCLNIKFCEQVTRVGLEYLLRRPHLSSLNLGGCRGFNRVSMHTIKQLTNLHQLNLSLCPWVNNTYLQKISPLVYLTHLELAQCQLISNIGIRHLLKFTHLTHLNLYSNSHLTDISLQYISQLTQLKYLNLRGCTGISQPAVVQLKQQLKECVIEY